MQTLVNAAPGVEAEMHSAAKVFEMLSSWTGKPSTDTALQVPSASISTLPPTLTTAKAVGVDAAKATFFAWPGARPFSTSLAPQREREREKE